MRHQTDETKTGGEVVSYYAPKRLVAAIQVCIQEKFGSHHGAKSRWFVEAAQRDLRARGLPDGSEPANEREALLNQLIEAVSSLPESELRAKVAELSKAAIAAAAA